MMPETARLRQEAAAWKADAERAATEMQALRLQLAEREKLGVEQANKILWHWEESEKLRRALRINQCDSRRMTAELEEIERNLRDITGLKDSIPIMIASLESERNALRKLLESATDFDFGGYTVYLTEDGDWLAFVGGKCAKCILGEGDHHCRFATFEEAEAAARKALEVAG
jgi:hypothetical protein